METTYTIEFMRRAEPPLAPIKRPSAFHVAYYCNLSATLLNPSGNGQIAELDPLCGSFLQSVGGNCWQIHWQWAKEEGRGRFCGPPLQGFR
ncbi:MAG: hypothetical protein WCA06_05825 [Terrimicrobiaceae bacterium]